MAEDQLRKVIDGIRARLQAELETQLGAVTETHDQALAEVRRAAEAAAEQRWAAKLDATRVELTARLHSEVAAARSEVERTMVAESMRVRVEAEQAAAESASHARREIEQVAIMERERAQDALETAAQARRELEQALAVERERTQAAADAAAQARRELEQAVAAERERAKAQVDAERERASRALAEARAAFEAERDRTAHAIVETRKTPAPANGTSALLDAIRAIDTAASLSDVLAAVVRGAALEAPRAALFIVHGTHLQEWPVPGVPAVHAAPIRADGQEAGLLADVLARGETMMTGQNGGPGAPSFASLPAGRVAIAVPFVLGGRPVAVLYADEGMHGQAPSSWQESVQILGRHASAYVAYLTAVRTAQALRLMSGAPESAGSAAGPDAEHEEAQGARRYARLLVSEIKLYNESAVRMGRERRDLLQRLKPEIERARRLYDERVAPSIRSREVYFQQELVQTLADGDHSLLG